ncbi:MAG: glycosidase [Prevotellaceae bacterium]|nr:glycosidase [Candidatus Minthosoma caballi]
MTPEYKAKIEALRAHHEELLARPNEKEEWGNGIYDRYKNPIVTAEHTPLEWRYDFNEKDNPYLMQRIMMNAALNSGAIKWNGKYLLIVRTEGADRKSFFAVAESPNGIDNFRFWDEPITMPEDIIPATNVYDMRITAHEDGWIYGVFCAERHDDSQPGDLSAATATAGIARTKDLKTWYRLPDLKSNSQQRNVVLHPEFIYTDEQGKIVNGKSSNGKRHYAFYTRPQDGFIDTGSGGGIGWGLVDDIENAEVTSEKIINARRYHTIMEVKNGEGPHPFKTPKGWLHLAHGVRGCASGLRYVLYMYMTALEDPTKVIAQPGGYFIVPQGGEYIGDVMNVTFANGWIADGGKADASGFEPMHDLDDRVLIYYASSDTRMHVAESTIGKLIDYCMNTPEDGYTTAASVETIKKLVAKNKENLK